MTPPGPGAPPFGTSKTAPWNAPEYVHTRRKGTSNRVPSSSASVGRSVRSARPDRTRTSIRSRPADPVRSQRVERVGRVAPVNSRPEQRPPRASGDRGSELAGQTLARFLVWSQVVLDETISAVRGRPSRQPLRRDPNAGLGASRQRHRLLLVLAAVATLFVVVIGKVVDLQVVSPDRYVAYGEAQRTNTQLLAADRGSILDRNGAELAISRPARSVFVDPKLIKDASAESVALASILGLDAATIQAKMTGSGRFAYIARKVSPEVADQVAELKLAGVAFFDESERYLPAGDSLRAILGSVDVDNAGISGLESQFASDLTGTPGKLSLERSPSGRTIAVGDHTLTPAQKGSDLVLTIDRSIQVEAERLLMEQVKATGSKGGTAIVTKPSTGEVLAIANVVSDPATGDVKVGTNNAALTTQYEPGSVMKMVTVASAIELGKVTPSTQLNLPPTMKFYDYEFGEAEGRGTVTWDVGQILTNSSNIGTIKVGQMVGKEALYDAQRLFGFGQKTGLEFPNEAAGAVLAPSKYSGTSLPSIAIGQGISVTPMQMLFAYNTIANKGVYVPAKLVQSTVDAGGVEHPTATGTTHRAISESTADQMNLMLRNVVSGGTGQLANIDGYLAAGKTGTARKPQPGGGYTDQYGVMRYQSTFVGFVPAEQPALSVYVMMDEPSNGDYTGGATAAPVFSKLGSFALRRLGIAPAATDSARGGIAVDTSNGRVAPAPATVVDGDRVRAVTAGTPEANPVQSVVPLQGLEAPTTTTTTRRSGTTG
jgi:cell division protein FtsI (penicillin-binding protein 3)